MNFCKLVFLYLPKTRKEAKALGLKLYYTGKRCKSGHLSVRRDNGDCLACARLINANWRSENRETHLEKRREAYHTDPEHYKQKNKRWAEENKEKVRERKRLYREKNKEAIAKRKRDYYERNREAIAERGRRYHAENREHRNAYVKAWRERNPETVKALARSWYKNNRERVVSYREENRDRLLEAKKANQKMRYNSEPDFKAGLICRRMLSRTLEASKMGKTKQTFEALGYGPVELKERMGSMFEEGMTWGNHGEWHIDHIKSVRSFIKEGITDPAIINDLDNLQPLWAEDNLKKSWK